MTTTDTDESEGGADHPGAEAAHGRTYDGRRLKPRPGGTLYEWDA